MGAPATVHTSRAFATATAVYASVYRVPGNRMEANLLPQHVVCPLFFEQIKAILGVGDKFMEEG